MDTEEFEPFQVIVGGASAIGMLLLLAPWTPPQAAVFGFIAFTILGVTVYYGMSLAADILYGAADEALPELPDEEKQEYPDIPVKDDTVDQYLNGTLTEAELEERIEDALGDENDKKVETVETEFE